MLFLHHALGSICEIETQLTIAGRLEFLPTEEFGSTWCEGQRTSEGVEWND